MSHLGDRPVVYFVCTGNAARSPMAAAMLRAHDREGRLDVRSAGTLVIEGQPMSVRTREALARHGLVDHAHRSRQFGDVDAAAADLVVVMEPLHVKWMRTRYPQVAPITATLRRLARDLRPGGGDQVALGPRLAALGLDSVEVKASEEVVDPESGDQSVFHNTAAELAPLVSALHLGLCK